MIAVSELLFKLGLECAWAPMKHRPPESLFTFVLMNGFNGTILLFYLNGGRGSLWRFFGPALQRFRVGGLDDQFAAKFPDAVCVFPYGIGSGFRVTSLLFLDKVLKTPIMFGFYPLTLGTFFVCAILVESFRVGLLPGLSPRSAVFCRRTASWLTTAKLCDPLSHPTRPVLEKSWRSVPSALVFCMGGAAIVICM